MLSQQTQQTHTHTLSQKKRIVGGLCSFILLTTEQKRDAARAFLMDHDAPISKVTPLGPKCNTHTPREVINLISTVIKSGIKIPARGDTKNFTL